MISQSIGRLIAAALVLVLCSCASQQRLYWRADDIAGMGASYVRLNHQGGTAGTVSSEKVRRLVSVKDRISRISGQHVQLLIADGTEPNAFAGISKGIPTVAVNLAMLELLGDDEDALAAIIGHEIAHLTLNHGHQRQERENARAGFAHALGFILGAVGVPMGGTISDVATTAVSNVYTRDEERQADRVGFEYMKGAGFNPHGAIRAWEKMAEKSRGSLLPFLSTHPQTEERIEEMKKLAAQ